MSRLSQHVTWLRFIDVAGPFITVEQLDDIFPRGLDAVYPTSKKRVRSAYEEWCEAVDCGDRDLDKLHAEWLRLVLQDFLNYSSEDLVAVDPVQPTVSFTDDLTGLTFAPDWILQGTDGTPFMFITTLPPNAGNRKQPPFPVDEMTRLCREKGVRLGLITNGEQWTIVHAPVREMSSAISWYARFWFQEPQTLQAFSSLLGVRRFFGPASERLPALMDKASEHQQTITDALGSQVRAAVEVLIQCLDRADADRNRELLREVSPAHLYEACLTVMMRLVFLLCAEERGLLLLGDPIYDAHYAITLLRGRLAEMADAHGAEVLERRYDAWAQIMAVFRAVYFGIDHEDLHLPALGGSLFDPEKYPFLEGRRASGPGRSVEQVVSLPIDNRTVLLLLTSLQVVEQPGGALVQSYRALDVEQIGYIYEGLLEHTAQKTSDVVLGLVGSDKAKNPTVELSRLESLSFEGADKLVDFLKERTGRSPAALRKAVDTLDETVSLPLEGELGARVQPFARLLRRDAWGRPAVYAKGSFMVTSGTDRRASGTHYTPKVLTERIVQSALEPVVYSGPAEGTPRTEWKLKTPNELLALKVCDPAMGSGAFLVQACRYLADRLVESWNQYGTADADADSPISTMPVDRIAEARRQVSEKCLYGVDINPLAVELAKLSLWLITISQGRPFGYLDHNLRAGDSLLGVHDIDQLKELRLVPKKDKNIGLLFGQNISAIIDEALTSRRTLRETRILDIRDVERMGEIDRWARHKLERLSCFADLFCGTVLATKGTDAKVAKRLEALDLDASVLLGTPEESSRPIQPDFFSPAGPSSTLDYAVAAQELLNTGLPSGSRARRPFHWAIEFPEVFSEGGFDAICGNPPFLGGKRLTGAFGTDYKDYIVRVIANGVLGEGGAGADFVSYFFLRSYQILKPKGVFGLIATNTISEGATRQVGLEQLIQNNAKIIAASPNMPWPGTAGVVISPVTIYKDDWNGEYRLNNEKVSLISPYLSAQDEWSPQKLTVNSGQSFIGSVPYNQGFILSDDDSIHLKNMEKYKNVVLPYLIGEELNSSPNQKSGKWIINFWDWPLDRNANGTWQTSEVERKKFLKSYHVPNDYPYDVASDYQELLQILQDTVKPERDKHPEKLARERWWCYQRIRSELYHISGRGGIFSTHPKGWKNDIDIQPLYATSKHRCFIEVSPKILIDQTIVIVTSSFKGLFSVLNSCFHCIWALNQGCTLGTGPRYTPSTCYETFPFPKELPESAEELGKKFDAVRREIMLAENIGLTKLYNAFHNKESSILQIERMRGLQVEIDELILKSYGWDDIRLDHGFHRVAYLGGNDNIRFTISEPARLEILKRLSKLNRERWEEEQKVGTP